MSLQAVEAPKMTSPKTSTVEAACMRQFGGISSTSARNSDKNSSVRSCVRASLAGSHKREAPHRQMRREPMPTLAPPRAQEGARHLRRRCMTAFERHALMVSQPRSHLSNKC